MDRAAASTDHHFRTHVAGICHRRCREGVMLAHKAEDEAVACAEIIAGGGV
jgi:dihydrolipoamide dehydrogenase